VKRFMDGEKEDAGFRVTVGGAKRMKRLESGLMEWTVYHK
jgi:hypothetical protein